MNHKRESELTQLRKDFEAQAEDHERSVADLRKKHASSAGEFEEQIEMLQKGKSKSEKERQALTSEVAELSGQLEDVQKAKVNIIDCAIYQLWKLTLLIVLYFHCSPPQIASFVQLRNSLVKPTPGYE